MWFLGTYTAYTLGGSPPDVPLDGNLGADVGPAGEIIPLALIGNVWGSYRKSSNLRLGIEKPGRSFSSCCHCESHKDICMENN